MNFIIFDMDDTLLNNDHQVSEYSLNVLKKLQNLGHKIVINTARSKFYNQEYFDIIKPDYAILNGGSLIIDKNENVIYKLEIDPFKVKDIIKDLLTYSITFSIQTDDQLYSFDPDYKNQGSIFFDFEHEDFNYSALKIIVSFNDQMIAEKIAFKYDIKYVPYFSGNFGRMNHKDASKENGNRKLLEILNHSLKDAIVFGDDNGDLNMINEAGVGVLMKNSDDSLKSKVKIISRYSNDQDGVARFLEEYFNLN